MSFMDKGVQIVCLIVMSLITVYLVSSGYSPTPESRLDTILRNQHINVAVRENLSPLSNHSGSTLKHEGFEIDIIREIVRRWFNDESPALLSYMEIDAAERIRVITNNDADLVIGALSINEGRDESIDFSIPYLNDGQKILTRRESGITNLCDISKALGVSKGTNVEQNVTIAYQKICMEEPDFRVEATYVHPSDQATDLRNETIEAAATDSIIISDYEDDELVVVGGYFSEEEYGIGLPEGDARLKELIDLTLYAMKLDSEQIYDRIHCKWLGDRVIYPFPGAPRTYEELIEELDEETVQLITSSVPSFAEQYPDCDVDPNQQQESYIANQDDTLSGISLEFYGTHEYWPFIYDENRGEFNLKDLQLTIP
ncbi:MAG: transporter substrate-binding domain-containing protein [Ardenticatenaceae bacterium]